MKIVANDLVPVYETDIGNKVVNGRELHQFLEVGKDFSTWMKDRIDKYGFDEGSDFTLTLTKIGERSNVTRHDYYFQLDCAKEIAMVENNEQGRMVRRYFIEVEKRSKKMSQFALPQTFSEALRALADSAEEKQTLQNKIESDKPLVLFAQSLQISKDSILVGELAKVLRQNEINIGQNRLFETLRKEGYLISRGEQYNMPTQRSMDLGIMEIKTGSRSGSDGAVHITRTTKITGKGQVYFINKFKQYQQAN